MQNAVAAGIRAPDKRAACDVLREAVARADLELVLQAVRHHPFQKPEAGLEGGMDGPGTGSEMAVMAGGEIDGS